MIAVEYKVEFVPCIDEAFNGENTATNCLQLEQNVATDWVQL